MSDSAAAENDRILISHIVCVRLLLSLLKGAWSSVRRSSMDGAATVLARMTHLVSTHQPRLLRAVGAALDEADKLPATPAPPCHADTLAQLCESFGINTEYQRSGKVGVGNDKLLYDARRLLVMLQKSLSVDEILVPPPVGQWSGTESGAPLSSSVGQAFAGMAGDMSLTNSADSDADNPTDPLKVVRCYWLAAVTLIPEVPSWQTAQTAALPVSEPLPMAMRAVMQAFYGDATQVAQMATYLAAVDAKEKRGGDLDKSSLAALYILQNTKAVLLKAQLVELLNFFRSVQRHLALSAANLLPTSPANLSSPDYNNDELQPFAHLDPPRQGQSVIDLSMPLGAADIGAPVHCPALGPNRSSERSDQAVADQCRGVDIRDSTRWIGGRESHWTRDQPISPSPSEGMTPRSVKLRCVRNGLGTRVLHQVVIADLHTLVVEVAATASHFEHARHKAGKEHVIPQRNSLRRASSAKAIDLMKRQVELSLLDTSAGILPATHSFVKCLTNEVIFQSAKAKFVQSLLAAYDEASFRAEFDDQAAEDCAWIAQLITDTMALRPRLDLDALSCDDAYASSTLVLRLKTTLLHRVLGHHVQAVETHMAALQHYSEATRLRRDSERFSTPADRRCASIALQIEARLRALVVELEKSVEKALRNDLPPVMYTRMEALILMQVLHISKSLAMLPPTKPTTTKKPASAAAARRASIEAIAKRNSTAVTLPWLDATIVTASVEARARSIGGRAVAMAGAATPDSTDLPLKAEILRKNPTLIAGASECAAVGLILHEVEELRATLKRKHPSLSWVPWIALLPQLKTSSASGTPPSSSSRGQLHERSLAQQQLAHRALASAKRFVVQLGKDGAVAARGEGGAASARCLLQLLMAERQALLLMLLRERICAKPVLPESPYLSLSGNPFRSRTFSDLVGGPETARLRKAASTASKPLTMDSEAACSKMFSHLYGTSSDADKEGESLLSSWQRLTSMSDSTSCNATSSNSLCDDISRREVSHEESLRKAYAQNFKGDLEVAFQASQVLLKNQLHELAKANYEKARNSKRSQVATAVVAEVDTSRLRTDLAGVKAALHDAQWRLSHAEEATRRRVHEEVQSEMKAISLEINFMTRALADSATIDMSEVKKALQKISSTQRTTFSSTRSAHSSPEKGLKESLREAMRDRIAESSKERDDVQLLVFKQMMFSRFTLAVAESIHSRKMRALAASSRKPSFRRKDSEEADEETEVLEAVRAAEAEKTAVTDQLHALEAEIAQLERDHAVLLKGKVDRITKPISLVVEEMTANCNSPRGVKG